MQKNTYSEEEIQTFLELAKEEGIAKAIRTLGYPTFPTAKQWGIRYGVELPLNELSQYVNGMKQLYSHEEKLYVTQLLIDRINESLGQDVLTADELKKLSESLKRAVETMNLVEGKATSITGTEDPFNNDLAALLEEQDRINRAKEQKNSIEE